MSRQVSGSACRSCVGGSSKGLGVRSEDEAGYDDWEYTLGEENLDSMRRGEASSVVYGVPTLR